MNDGVDFTFDPAPFLAGINKASAGLGGLLGKAGDIEKKITSGVGKAMNGLIGKVGLLFAGFKSLGAALKEMPEVGMAFGIAKDVFLKNLLWPLRQQIMPILQRMLDWTRDSRALFVRWGATVANVFGAAVTTAKVLWDVFKDLVAAVGDSFQKAFHTNFKTFDEFLNVLSFKVSAVIIYLGMASKELVADLAPAFDWVMNVGETVVSFFVRLAQAWTGANDQGKSLGTVMEKIGGAVKLIAGFIEAAAEGFEAGFLPAVRNAMTPIDSLAGSLERMLKTLGFGDKDGIRGAFSSLGSILGTALVGTLSAVAALFDGLVTTLGTLAQLAKVVGAIFEGDWSRVSTEWKAIGPAWDEWKKRQDELWGAVLPPKSSGQVHDGIITKDGKVIKTDPDDNIYAFKDLGGRGRGGGAVQVINHVQLMVTEGDAERAGYEFMAGLARGGGAVADALADSRMAEGY